jgi:hypothetical protein
MGKHKEKQEYLLDEDDGSLEFDFEDDGAEFMFDLGAEEDDPLARKRRAERKKQRINRSIDDDEWSEYADHDRW